MQTIKKVLFAFVSALLFLGCQKKEDMLPAEGIGDGIYIYGMATGMQGLDSKLEFTKGLNALKGTFREGLWEKYVRLQGGKEFCIVQMDGGKQTLWGASLSQSVVTPDGEGPGITVFRGAAKHVGSPAMKVESDGLYHVVADFDAKGDLAEEGGPQIILSKVETFGLLCDWDEGKWVAMNADDGSDSGLAGYSAEVSFPKGGTFVFSYGGRTLNIDKAGKIRVNTTLGGSLSRLVPGGEGIVPDSEGEYTVHLRFSLAAGGIKNSFSARLEHTGDIDLRAEAIRAKVINSPNTVDPSTYSGGQCYYVSAEGNDTYDGRRPDRAIQSLAKLNTLNLQPGDAVLFRRGDTWRRTSGLGDYMITTKQGVTYSAYGEGPKPVICGSPFNGAAPGVWTLTDVQDVYLCTTRFSGDVGGIFLDGGDSAFKVMISLSSGSPRHIDTGEPFSGWQDLKNDLDFYQEEDRLYLCSKQGNPSDRFSSMEFNVHGNAFRAVHEITIDNICIKHVGAHGVGSPVTRGLTVTNCEIGWIGGSIQPGQWKESTQSPVRYGNGIEVYGGCKYYTINNCWVYQCYDAGITHQYSRDRTDAAVMENITYSGNLIEDCVYSIEYFLHLAEDSSVERMMRNVLIKDNVCRRAGYGWGKQRPDKYNPRQIRSGSGANPAENFVIRDNVFDRCTHELLQIQAQRPEWMPVMENNICIE